MGRYVLWAGPIWPSNEKVWERLYLERSVTVFQTKKGSSNSAQDAVMELRNLDIRSEKRIQVLESIRVSLKSNPVSWVQEFGTDGLNQILHHLTYTVQK